MDDILRQAVRKFAKMFILKKITLDFQETGKTVLTDEKWLLFAAAHKETLIRIASEFGVTISEITASPVEGLVRFHTEK